MRTLEEIRIDLDKATSINNAEALQNYAVELDKIGTPEALALANQGRGMAQFIHGDYSAALKYYHSALALFDAINKPIGVASATSNIGNIHLSTGDHPAALEHYHRALALHEKVGSRSGMAHAACNIGIVFYSTGDYPLALEHYDRAIALHEELGNRNGVARLTVNIGVVHSKTGNFPSSMEHFNRALALFEELGDRSNAARATSNIGNVMYDSGAVNASLDYYRRALTTQEELGDRGEVSRVTGNLIQALIDAGMYNEATKLLDKQASMIMDDPEVRAEHLANLAKHAESTEDLDTSAAYLKKALVTAREAGLRSMESHLHKRLRDLSQKRNDLAGYVEHNTEFTRITEEINGKETALKIAMQAKQREIDAREKEHEKHMAVLHSTLPKHIADRVARGEVVTDHFENAGVLFLDVVGFTNNSALLEAGEVVELLQNIFTTFDSICAKHNVTKIKTIGDAYMAVAFPVAENGAGSVSPGNNLPDNFSRTISPGHFSHHVYLALASIEIINSNFTWSHNSSPVEFRIGLHSGPVVAGVLGTERMQYDVWGDTVNVASRMESTGEPGRIHVSDMFANALEVYREQSSPTRSEATLSRSAIGSPEGSHIVFIPRGEIEVKGKGTMQTFWLEGTILDSLADNGYK